MNQANPNLVASDLQPLSSIRIISIHNLLKTGIWQIESPRARRTHLFLWITKGQGRFSINGRARGFSTSTILFVPAGSVYGFRVSKHTQGFALYVPQHLGLMFPKHPAQIKAQSIFEQGEVTSYFDNLNKEVEVGDTGMQRVQESYATLLGVWVDRARARDEFLASPGSGTAASRLVERFLKLTEKNLRAGWSVTQYAEALKVTPTHLSRVCTEMCGQPASSLLQDRLVLEAKLLLHDTDMKIHDISSRLSVSSPAYFSRMFTKATKSTPRAFRQSSRTALK